MVLRLTFDEHIGTANDLSARAGGTQVFVRHACPVRTPLAEDIDHHRARSRLAPGTALVLRDKPFLTGKVRINAVFRPEQKGAGSLCKMAARLPLRAICNSAFRPRPRRSSFFITQRLLRGFHQLEIPALPFETL